MSDETLQLFTDEPSDNEVEETVIQTLEKSDPSRLSNLCRHLVGERQGLRKQLAKATVAAEKARADRAEMKAMVEKLTQPPLLPAIVLRVCEGSRIDLVVRGGRQIAAVHPELDAGALRSGDEVWLDAQSGIVVSRGEDGPRLGRVASVLERMGERVVVRGDGDEDRVVLCDEATAARIEVGDRVLLSNEVPCVLEHLPARVESGHLLQTPPRVSFEDVGGLDTLVEELRQELELQLFHEDLVEAFQMPLMRGMTFVGPPGVGKTLLAKAVARFLADEAPDTRFMNVSPGSLRGSYYGQTEARIRELFQVARAAPGIVVMFFDELDSFGARGGSAGHEIDDRVMGTLLAEVDGLAESDRIFVIGATNRLDLIDEAILRQGRFGDRIVDVPRPSRAAARSILGRLLGPALAWAEACGPEAAVSAAASFLYAPEGGAGAVVRVTFADGSTRDVRARDVVSGALMASSVREAKKAAAIRKRQGGPGLCESDVVDALDLALGAEARKLSSVQVARRSLSIPRAREIVSVEIPTERGVGTAARLRAA
jgi:proteasome ATPase